MGDPDIDTPIVAPSASQTGLIRKAQQSTRGSGPVAGRHPKLEKVGEQGGLDRLVRRPLSLAAAASWNTDQAWAIIGQGVFHALWLSLLYSAVSPNLPPAQKVKTAAQLGTKLCWKQCGNPITRRAPTKPPVSSFATAPPFVGISPSQAS